MNNGPEPRQEVAAQPETCGVGAPEVRSCWNEIGVQGDRTCPDLRKVIHCRNCPVYSSAGVLLLNRALPEGYRRECTERYARGKELAPRRGGSAVLFRLNAEWLAMPAEVFQEVAERRRIHSLPHRNSGVLLGLANIRGELLVCVSLGHLLGLERLPARGLLRNSYHRLLVVSWEGNRFAFPVDEIPSTVRLDPDELKAPPATVAKSNPCYTRGVFYWREHAVGFLDPDLLFPALNRSLT